jgi:hypothetical protein
MQVLSLAFDLLFFCSLAFLFVGFAGLEPTAVLGLGGLVVPLCLMYRTKSRYDGLPKTSDGSGLLSLFKRKKAAKEITCNECHRTLPAGTKICRYCLATIDHQLNVVPSLSSPS